jgi:hypothetical protein
MSNEETIALTERLVHIVLAVVFTCLASLWIAAIWWTWKDIRRRSADVVLHITAMVLVTAFSFLGLWAYFVLRPESEPPRA